MEIVQTEMRPVDKAQWLSFHKQASKRQTIAQVVADRAATSTIRKYQWQTFIKGRLETWFSRDSE